jgi:hypothetical protein
VVLYQKSRLKGFNLLLLDDFYFKNQNSRKLLNLLKGIAGYFFNQETLEL